MLRPVSLITPDRRSLPEQQARSAGRVRRIRSRPQPRSSLRDEAVSVPIWRVARIQGDFPRLSSRGPMEATPLNCVSAIRPGFPRLRSRGTMEAYRWMRRLLESTLLSAAEKSRHHEAGCNLVSCCGRAPPTKSQDNQNLLGVSDWFRLVMAVPRS